MSTEELRKERLEEYKFLREELHSAGADVHSVFTFMLALIGLIITAAYNQKGQPEILLPLASLVSVGAYYLLRVQTTRSWRLVGYMRRELEPGLEGIRWETRLHAWRLANEDLETVNLFDAQIRILHWINGGLGLALLLRPWISLFIDDKKLALDQAGLVSMISSLVPFAVLFGSWLWWKKNKGMDTKHFEAWGKEYPEFGGPVCKAEPREDLLHLKQAFRSVHGDKHLQN